MGEIILLALPLIQILSIFRKDIPNKEFNKEGGREASEKPKELLCDLCFNLADLDPLKVNLYKLLLKKPDELNNEEIKEN